MYGDAVGWRETAEEPLSSASDRTAPPPTVLSPTTLRRIILVGNF